MKQVTTHRFEDQHLDRKKHQTQQILYRKALRYMLKLAMLKVYNYKKSI